MKKLLKKLRPSAVRKMRPPMLIFIAAFAVIGGLIIFRSQAAPGTCSTTSVIGTVNYSLSVPETAQYRIWVRMQVPDTTNTNNTNGVRLELAGNQCFVVTTTSTSAVNQWMWVNSDALAATTPHITTSLTAGTINAKVLGMKAGVKVDKVLLLKSDNTCTPDNTLVSGGAQPGDNCTTPAPTVTLTANPTTINSGTASTLTWSSTNATTCTASGGWTGTKATSGTQSTGNLVATTSYTLTCNGVGGVGTASRTVTVNNITPSPSGTTISPGSGTITDNAGGTWTVTTGGIVQLNGANAGSTANVNLLLWYNNKIYQRNTSGGWWSWTGTTWAVEAGDPRPAVPTVNITANPQTVNSGSSSTLSWSTTGATSCTSSGGWTGARATSGTFTTNPLTATTTFNLSCTGTGGTGSGSVTVTVNATSETTPPTVTMTIPGVTLTAATTSVVVNDQRGVKWQPTATDASGIKSLVLTVNDQPVTLTNGEVGVGIAANGNFVLKAVATDNANNVTTSTLTVKVRHPDFDRSGQVGLVDLSLLLSMWNLPSDQYDIDDKGKVDLFDLSILLNRWNSTL